MLGKLLLTLLVIAIAWQVIRKRYHDQTNAPDGSGQAPTPRPALIPAPLVRLVAYAVMALMVVGSGLYLFQGWFQNGARPRDLVEVQVVNPATGAVQSYQVQRGDIDGRSFRTLDNRVIHIAEIERLIVVE